NRCKAEDAIGCNRIIQVLADKYPEFKNCVCTTDYFCSIVTLLGKGVQKPVFIIENYLVHKRLAVSDPVSPGVTISKTDIREYSQESQALAASENDNDEDDHNDDDGDDDDDDKNQDTNTENINTETKLQWSLSALSKKAYTANRTCLDVNKECVEDEVCNKQLSLYLRVCSVSKCNMEECQAAIRFFYQNMPFEVAQMMTFCDCIQPDVSCQRAKELLHGKPCAVTAVPPPSCLNVIHLCEKNELCRKKYSTFRSKCWRHVTKRCYEDEACLEMLIKGDMPCSASADCKAAYIGNWGTMLRVECTCQNLTPVELSLCKLFHHMLHSKSCFSDL
ncbi:PREDICTED: GDNF family receptor alpha-like, partial [Mesitornis unicolor]|uniref:GDNF family receptor alpha-like n=1 Tax=Mesitornis unicolor TaxID=54374 RepID=UPI00052883FB